MQTQPRAMYVSFLALTVGCAGGTAATHEDVSAQHVSARFASRQTLESQQPLRDERGRPYDLNAAIITEGSCYAVKEKPGRHVCVGGDDVVFPITPDTAYGSPLTRGVFVGDADSMTLYRPTSYQSFERTDTYMEWAFDDAAHVHTPPALGAGVGRAKEEPPDWFLIPSAPALRIQRSSSDAHSAYMTCGTTRLTLRPMAEAQRRMVFASTAFSAPDPRVSIYVMQTRDGVLVSVARMRDRIGRQHVIVEVDGVKVDAMIETFVPRFPNPRAADDLGYSYDLVGGGSVSMGWYNQTSFKSRHGAPTQQLTDVDDGISSLIYHRLEAELRERISSLRTSGRPMHRPHEHALIPPRSSGSARFVQASARWSSSMSCGAVPGRSDGVVDDLRNPSSRLCLDSYGKAGPARMNTCHGKRGNLASPHPARVLTSALVT